MTADRFDPKDTEEIVMKMIYKVFKDTDEMISMEDITSDILVKLGKENISEKALLNTMHRLTQEGFISKENELGKIKMEFCGDLDFEEEY
jgi:hypothetical protein